MPADLNIKHLHLDYIEKLKNPISYEKYRKTLDETNISFYNVEADKCGFCIERDMSPIEENILLKQPHLEEVSFFLMKI